jgi:spore coat protein U-like protein
MNRHFKKKACACAAALSLFVSPWADAGVKTATFDVTMRIVADCAITAGNMDFGQNQGLLTNAVSASSTLTVTCTNTTAYNIGLNAGTGVGSTIVNRTLSGTGANAQTVLYHLNQTAGGTNWGNTQGVDTLADVGTGVAKTHTVYGVVPPQNSPAPDSYKSTITATVYF